MSSSSVTRNICRAFLQAESVCAIQQQNTIQHHMSVNPCKYTYLYTEKQTFRTAYTPPPVKIQNMREKRARTLIRFRLVQDRGDR